MIPPGLTIGILGGGQLGRMLAQAAAVMGYHTHIYCPEKDCPAAEVATITTTADYHDIAALKAFAANVDVITYEFENIPSAPLAAIAKKIKPGLSLLETCQHRIREKTSLNKIGIATAPFAPVRSEKDLQIAIKRIGLPAVLKTATMGYDGKGQWKITSLKSLPSLASGQEYILEAFIPFRMEISVIVARGMDGSMACFDTVENIHKHHILSETIAPARIPPKIAKQAQIMAKKIAEGLGLVGILAVEMFITNDNKILVNELAPRPHNSGHWTMDGCVTSQFEQTIRAICGLKLGSPRRLCNARMLNLIGDDVKQWKKYAAAKNAKLHLYGKKETRPGRKMGHVTFLMATAKN